MACISDDGDGSLFGWKEIYGLKVIINKVLVKVPEVRFEGEAEIIDGLL